MKWKVLISTIEKPLLNTSLTKVKGRTGTNVSVVYGDFRLGGINLLNLNGKCLSYRRNGRSTRVKVMGYLKPVNFVKTFFVHSPQFLDFRFK